ncbi:MAG: hypothetical protein IKM98_11545 [Bacteroidales bacterium]|nr:hypothetical protein [Bacteroidales bacterium]
MYKFPFGQEVHKLVQQDRSPKKVFVLGVYASAVHAKWKDKNGKLVCQALAVASEPRIFWDGNEKEAAEIISKIHIPEELGSLEPAASNLNGPSAKVLDENVLAPLGFTRNDAWLCDLLPESRLNDNQIETIEKNYNPIRERYGLDEVTVPKRPKKFCDQKRCEEILAELEESKADLLVLLGEDALTQFFNNVAGAKYNNLQKFVDENCYGKAIEASINGRTIKVLPLTHPRQIGALGSHSEEWHQMHQNWEQQMRNNPNYYLEK